MQLLKRLLYQLFNQLSRQLPSQLPMHLCHFHFRGPRNLMHFHHHQLLNSFHLLLGMCSISQIFQRLQQTTKVPRNLKYHHHHLTHSRLPRMASSYQPRTPLFQLSRPQTQFMHTIPVATMLRAVTPADLQVVTMRVVTRVRAAIIAVVARPTDINLPKIIAGLSHQQRGTTMETTVVDRSHRGVLTQVLEVVLLSNLIPESASGRSSNSKWKLQEDT